MKPPPAVFSFLPHRFALLLALCFLPMLSTQADDLPNARRWIQAAPPVPEFLPPTSLPQWNKDRIELRQTLHRLLGALPKRPTSPVTTLVSREDRGDFLVENLRIDNAAGASIPAQLLLPKSTSSKHPAILYCHWHGGEYDKGKVEIWRSDHTPEAPGPALVKRGFAVLVIDAYCFGERNGAGPGGPSDLGSSGEMSASKFNLWYGRSLWGMILRDDLIALDYLTQRPDIDAHRIGVTGISMGATRSWWLMALDERIKVGSAVACLTRYQNLTQQEGLKYHGIYFFVPGMLQHFDTEAIVALIAPRPLLLMNGDQDHGSPVDGIRFIESKVKPVYALSNQSELFVSQIYPNTGHVYLPEMWQQTLAWFKRHL